MTLIYKNVLALNEDGTISEQDLTKVHEEFSILSDIVEQCGGEDVILHELRNRYKFLSKKLFGGIDAGYYYCPYIPLQFTKVIQTETT